MIGIPCFDLANAKSQDVVSAICFRIKGGIDRYNCRTALIKERHDNILSKSSSSLVEIGFNRQTIIETAINVFQISVLLICSYMTHINRSNIDTNSRINRGD